MDWNRDGKQDWRDGFITHKLLSDPGERPPSGPGSGCLTALLAMLTLASALAFFLLH